MRTRKILFFVIFLISGCAVVTVFLSAVLYIILPFPPVQQYILTVTKPFYENIFNGKTSIGGVNSNLINFFVIKNIEIRDTVQLDNKVSIDELRVNFWLPALLNKKVVINSVSVKSVSVYMSISADYKSSFPAMPRRVVTAKKSSEKPWKIEIDAAKIKKLNIEYQDSSHGVSVSIKNAVVEADFYRIDSLLLSVKGFENSIKTLYWSDRLDTISMVGMITSEGALVEKLTIKGPSLLSQINGFLPFVLTGSCDLNGYIRAALKPFFLKNARTHQVVEGVMTVKAHWGGTFERPIVSINADGTKIKTDKIPKTSVNIECEYKDDYLSLIAFAQTADLKAKVVGGSVISGITSNPQLGKYSAKISLEGKTVSALKILLPGIKPVTSGKINVAVETSGVGLSLPDNGEVDLVVETNKDKMNNLAAKMVLKNNSLKIDGTWAKNKIVGDGVLTKDLHLTGKLKLSFPEVQPVVQTLIGQKITGQIESDLSFSVALPSLEIKSDLRCENLKWKTITVSKLSGKIDYKDKLVLIEELKGSISGECDSLLRFFNIYSSGGNAKIDIILSGSWPKLNADVTFSGTDIYYKQVIAKKIAANFIISTADSIHLKNVSIENDMSRIVADGHVVFKPQIVINMAGKTELKSNTSNWNPAGVFQANGVMINGKVKGTLVTSEQDISIVNQWIPLQYSVSGVVTSNVEVNGSLDNPELKAEFEILGAGFDNFHLKNIKCSVNVIDSVINSKILLFVSDTSSHIQVDATLPIRPQRNWSIDQSDKRDRVIVITSDTFSIEDIGLSKENTFAMKGPVFGKLVLTGNGDVWGLDGKINLLGNEFYYKPNDVSVDNVFADVRIQGSSDNPEVSLKFSSGGVNVNSEIITQSQLEGGIKDKKIHIDSATFWINHRNALTIKGQMPLVPIDTLLSKSEFFVNYKMVALPLKLLELAVPNVYITEGAIDGSGTIFIKNGKFQSEGLLSLKNGIVETELINQKIGPIKGNIVFNGDSVMLEKWSGIVDKGSFVLDGNGALLKDGSLKMSLSFLGKNILIDAQDIVKLQMQKVDLHLRNGRQKNHYLLEGNINFGPTRFIRDIQINDFVSTSKSQNEKIWKKSIFDSVDLRLELQFQDNLYIDMNLGNMQLEGALAVSGIVTKPAITGEINAVQGSVFYLDRKFEIDKGNINFVSPTELNPSIYLDAKTEVNTFAQGSSQNLKYTITLIVSGNLEHPVVVLTSDPVLDEPNIISVLTLGTPLGSVGSDIVSRIGSMVGNKFLGFGTRTLERLLGLENITVSGNIFDSKDSLNSPQLSLTKRLSDRLTLSYESTFDTSKQQKISILYRLFPFLFLTGETDNSGNSKISLKFRVYR